MQIYPIKTEQDHASALEWIESHMNAVPGTEDGEVLDALATLVVEYEAKHYAIDESMN
jgi:HTH-type transcriptional regulator/antitoxin HigA